MLINIDYKKKKKEKSVCILARAREVKFYSRNRGFIKPIDRNDDERKSKRIIISYFYSILILS